ncbi:MAG: NUDIX domain-containing protein [Alphaproteobacteria bacterium]|nr:MAG: NUDIX domain-containing protein [Alphaproteobacteria bacterium]
MVNKQIISAKAVIFHEGRVLLLERANGRWDLPGGHVAKKEPVLQALIREVKEETGLDIEVQELLSTHIHENRRGDQVATLAYLCESHKKPSEKNIHLSKEHQYWTLAKPAKLERYKIRPHHREAIVIGAERGARTARKGK